MRQRYLRYYEKPSPLASWVFLKDSLFTRSKLRKLSLANRNRDYVRVARDPELLELHRSLNQELLKAQELWSSYDYGEGYFYQGFETIGVSGLRNTAARVEAMGLRERVAGKTVLEIGCNAGFLSLSIADVAERVLAFDLNPHLVRIGELTAEHLGITNVDFRVAAFEDLLDVEPFDVVLSFANHSTYDGNTQQDVEEYFDRCHGLTQAGGEILFESHPPQHEGEGLHRVCEILEERFAVHEREVLRYGSFLDTDRTFVAATAQTTSAMTSSMPSRPWSTCR